jgi:peroxiredoxin Q/BCP
MVVGMHSMEEKPVVGDFAPDFSLKDPNGDDVKLSNYRGRVNVLLAFYRGASDPYSMRWLSGLNDDYLFFRSLETDVLAISPDDVDKARDTVTRYKIPFRLLSDPDLTVIKEYSVFDDLENGDDASVFIIDKGGKIRYKCIGIVPSDLPPNDKLMETIRDMT